jgi:hypothetical protein
MAMRFPLKLKLQLISMNVSPPSMITMMGYHCHSVHMQRAPQKHKFALQGHSSNPKKISSSYVTVRASYLDSVILNILIIHKALEIFPNKFLLNGMFLL